MTTYLPATVVDRFADVVARFGARPAIRHGRTTVTYEELARRADRIAAHLVDGQQVPDVIGVSLTSVPEMLATMFAIMKIGSAYTILDTGFSAKRKQAVVDEMALTWIVSDQASPEWDEFSGRWIDARAISDDSTKAGVFRSVPATARCCIVQTSGTTGQPLGVEISHSALLHTIDNYRSMAEIGPHDRFTMLTSAAYFAAQSPMFGALLSGACLLPFDAKTLGLRSLADWIEEEGLTIYQSPPSLFRALCRQLPEGKRFSTIRFLRLGGEPVLRSDLELFGAHFPENAQFVNALGISEAGGNVAYFKAPWGAVDQGPLVPIGVPSPGQDVILADESGNPVSHGEVGEIVVRGEFLASGYYRRPDMTAQKFRTSAVDGRRELYTGDLAHQTPEGWLMHDGRKDDQVKISGHRVNLVGLGSVLLSIHDVREARVLPLRRQGNSGELFAFVVPANSGVTAASIRMKLRALVTSPVIPRVIIVEQLPLTLGGKIDRARLLQIVAERHTGSSPSPARNATERELCKIWTSTLGISEVGVYDNFFAIGGDSLAALNASSTVEKHFDLPFSPWLFVDRPTIAQMGEYIDGKRKRRAVHRWFRSVFRERPQRVVALRTVSNRSGESLFVCPGGWGQERELLAYAAMVGHLPPKLSVYGLKQNFLANSIALTEGADTMARYFVTAMRKIRPRGPYHLLGECIASLMVLEMARQLHLAGIPAKSVILLDPRQPNVRPPNTGAEPPEVANKVRAYYRALAGLQLQHVRQRVHVVGTEEPAQVTERLRAWNIFDDGRLEVIRVSGDHATYMREHGEELAHEIARIISGRPT